MFPYLDILKKAYELARKHLWLWVWGFFLSGITIVNLSSFRLPGAGRHFRALAEEWLAKQNYDAALWFTPTVLAGLLLLLVLYGLAKTATVWAAGELLKPPAQQRIFPTLKRSFLAAKKHFAPVLGQQILITLVFALLLLLFALPIYYLFLAEAVARAIVLLILAVAIFLPVTLIFGFLHLFGPIFIVLYERDINESLALSFRLIRQKFKECIVLSAFLIGLEILFVAAVAFSLILFALPVAILLLPLIWLNFPLSVLVITGTAFFAAGLYAIVLKSGFAIFTNIAWVLAVQEMVKTQKFPAEAKALAAEPVA